MTVNKDLKRVVRARMKKTGESYTAARSHIISKPSLRVARPPVARDVAVSSAELRELSPKDYAKIAGMSDAKVKEKTGCTWEKWVYALDRRGASELTHREIADIVHTKYKVGPWWTQMVTVGYERIKGIRARGQRRDGSYEANKSRTYNVDVETLFDAWATATQRRRWLKEPNIKVRTATKPKSLRFGWSDGSIIAVGFLPKGKGKSSVALSHGKLADKETVARVREFWTDRLDALGEVLAS